ncbi:hypothetical protein Q8A67_019487 [Cirrhinus molitorella]|uniref:Uncharacterized protein n=1 Tax=Cirrhinus molitorella TaxID=172907 RepID=A0AA88TGF2_9TELE|nr:hypothetical protein Q8A67_019487 [Cirrhinus molitorella]
MDIIKQHGVAEARGTGPSGVQGYEAAPLSRCNRAIVDTLFPANLQLSSERGCHGNLLLPGDTKTSLTLLIILIYCFHLCPAPAGTLSYIDLLATKSRRSTTKARSGGEGRADGSFVGFVRVRGTLSFRATEQPRSKPIHPEDLAALPSSFGANHAGHPLTSKISTRRHNVMGGCLLNERPANSRALPMCFIVTFEDKLSLMFMRKSETRFVGALCQRRGNKDDNKDWDQVGSSPCLPRIAKVSSSPRRLCERIRDNTRYHVCRQRGDGGACDILKTYSTKWPYRIPALSSEIPERGVVIVVRPVPVHPSHPVLRLFLHRLHRPVTDISEIDCRGRCAVLTGHLLVMRTEQGNLREWCPMELLASMDRSSPPSTADQCQTHRPPVIGSGPAEEHIP